MANLQMETFILNRTMGYTAVDQVCNNTVCSATVPDIDSTYNGSNIHCVARSASSDPYVNTPPVNAATQVQGTC